MNYNILLVGYGNIGKRYLEGILKSKLNISVLIIDNNIDERFEDKFKNKIYISVTTMKNLNK